MELGGSALVQCVQGPEIGSQHWGETGKRRERLVGKRQGAVFLMDTYGKVLQMECWITGKQGLPFVTYSELFFVEVPRIYNPIKGALCERCRDSVRACTEG